MPNITKLTLTQDLLLVRRIEIVDPKTDWGFVLPPVEDSASTPYRGVVVFAGAGRTPKLSSAGKAVVEALEAIIAIPAVRQLLPGALLASAERAIDAQATAPERIPMQVKAGDTVIYSRNLLQEFVIDGETLAAMGQDSVLGVIEA